MVDDSRELRNKYEVTMTLCGNQLIDGSIPKSVVTMQMEASIDASGIGSLKRQF